MAKPKQDKRSPQNDIGAKAKPFIDRMEYLDAEMKAKREEVAESRKMIMEEAEAAGIQPKALKRILRLRKLQAQINELPEKLEDIDARAQFAALAEAFGDSPFGDFARDAGEKLRDMHTRDDEEQLQRIGRGHPGDDIDQIAE